MISSLAFACSALALTVIGVYLRRASRDPQTARGDAVLIDLSLGLVVVAASVLWLQVLMLAIF